MNENNKNIDVYQTVNPTKPPIDVDFDNNFDNKTLVVKNQNDITTGEPNKELTET